MTTKALITRRLLISVSLACAFFLATSPCLSQTNTENFAQFEFNFNNPGARATGIGGAFISVADDPTAAEANPAGLTTLIRPEFSFEMKGTQWTRNVSNYSHQGTPTSYTMLTKDFNNGVASPSFASAVVPFGKFVTSVFRHELVNFKTSYYTKGSYVPPLTDGSYFFPVRSDLDMTVADYGLAFSYKFSRMFSAGISGGLSTMALTSDLSRYFMEVFDPGNIANAAIIDGNELDFFVNAGVLVRASNKISIGAVVKRRPSFSTDHDLRITSFPKDTTITKTIDFNVPSSFGIGVSYRPIDVLTFSFDAVYILYSQLSPDSITVSEPYTTSADYTVDNGIEFHFGAEYVLLLRSVGFVFRAGMYTDPDHRIRFTGKVDDTDPSDPDHASRTFARTALAALFQPGKDVLHGTFGIGVLLSNNFQLDVAGNLSSRTQEVVGSIVIRL